MRLYSFVNYYLSPLQHGLQTAHCVADMAGMVANLGTDYISMVDKFYSWSRDHKTIIICNGGNVAMLEDLFLRLVDHAGRFGLPLVKFYEDEQSLNNALTSVAILVPQEFYDAQFVKGTTGPDLYRLLDADGLTVRENYIDGSPEFAFISLIKSFRLA